MLDRAAEGPILDAIKEPHDLRLLNEDELRKVADELRAETISAVAVTGGHLGAGLGVVELTWAVDVSRNMEGIVTVLSAQRQFRGCANGFDSGKSFDVLLKLPPELDTRPGIGIGPIGR